MPTVSWRKNRNLHAALLLQAIRKRDFREPFHRGPPDGPLQTLGGGMKIRAREAEGERGRGFWDGIHRKVRRAAERSVGGESGGGRWWELEGGRRRGGERRRKGA